MPVLNAFFLVLLILLIASPLALVFAHHKCNYTKNGTDAATCGGDADEIVITGIGYGLHGRTDRLLARVARDGSDNPRVVVTMSLSLSPPEQP